MVFMCYTRLFFLLGGFLLFVRAVAGVAGSARAAAGARALSALAFADLVPHDGDENDGEDGCDDDGGENALHNKLRFCGAPAVGHYFLEVLTLTASLF